MKSSAESALTVLLLGVILLHLSVSPYTKVEESFNIQATHDIITYGVSFSNTSSFLKDHYDHVEFPGSVPRTFVGAVVLAGLAKLSQMGFYVKSTDDMQFMVRGILGLINAISLLSFRNAVSHTFGKTAGNWYILLQASQFHVIYYASRTLPNMYAFALTTLAFASIIMAMKTTRQQSELYQSRVLFLITFAGVIFRSELAVLVFTLSALILFFQGPKSIMAIIIPPGIGGLILGLLITVSIDSYFWQSFPIWPEWSSFYYNTVLGKSSDWGISPWHFYFTNALPRLLLNPLSYTLLIPIAISQSATRSRTQAILIPSLSFVTLYSLLPHKEWRFIIYIIPGLTAVAAVGASWIWQRRSKALLYRLLNLVLISSILASFAASAGILLVSSLNYPGGQAIVRLRDIASTDQGSLHVYADNLACQTGVTRFLEARSENTTEGRQKWIFDKTEDPKKLLDPLFWDQFDYAMVENVERSIGKWEVIDVVEGFAGVGLLRPGQELALMEEIPVLRFWNELGMALRQKVARSWWVTLKMEPKLKILKRQRSAPNSAVGAEAQITQEVIG